MNSLQKFVRIRGLEQGDVEMSRLRPRTCIMTNVDGIVKNFADVVFYVSKAGVAKIEKLAETEA